MTGENDASLYGGIKPPPMLCTISSEYLLTESEMVAKLQPEAYKTKFTWSKAQRKIVDKMQ